MIQFLPTLAVMPLSLAVHSIRSSIQRRLILTAEQGYEEARLEWSRKVDQHPAMVPLAEISFFSVPGIKINPENTGSVR
jgi:hypothetical protein